jgi:hypothetical protein
MQIPSLIEISPTNLLNLDEKAAYEHFFGKSLAEARHLFDQARFYVDDLGWMGPVAFDYYVCAYIEHLNSRDILKIDICDAMTVVVMRIDDEHHHNIKKLINKIAELRKKNICEDRRIERNYDEAVQKITGQVS